MNRLYLVVLALMFSFLAMHAVGATHLRAVAQSDIVDSDDETEYDVC